MTAEEAEPGPAILVDALTKRYRRRAAVDGVSFRVSRGEVFGIIGPDGAGKTTLLRMLCGVLIPDSGTAHVAGHDVVRHAESVKRRIGYLSQAFSLYGDLTIEENLDFCADLYLTPRREVPAAKDRLLGMTGLTPFRDRQVGRLSGGMKQKTALACALIHTPEVLILDEPTTGVDPISRRDFWRLLAELGGQGVTVILSSPYMDEAARCHRLVMMSRGRVLAEGTADDVRRRVPHSVLEVLTPNVRQAESVLAGAPGVFGVVPFGDALHVFVDPARSARDVESVLTAGDVPFASVDAVEPSLEDAFLELAAGEGSR